jgi:hypothetical protein
MHYKNAPTWVERRVRAFKGMAATCVAAIAETCVAKKTRKYAIFVGHTNVAKNTEICVVFYLWKKTWKYAWFLISEKTT